MTIISAATICIIGYILIGVVTKLSGAAFNTPTSTVIFGWPGVWWAHIIHRIGG